MNRMNYLFITAIIILMIAALILMSPLLPIPDPYSAYNVYWNGYSEAVYLCNATVKYYGINDAKTVIIIPMIKPSPSFIGNLINFTRNGGVLIIISNGVYYGNYILKYMGINASFSNSSIIDPVINYVNPNLPIAMINPAFQNAIGAQYILLDNSSYIILPGKGNYIIIAETSSFSKAGNINGPFPVIAEIPYGNGSVILIADPSIFMNSMINYYGNSALLRWLCDHGNTVFLEGFIARVTLLDVLRIYGKYAYTELMTVWAKYLIMTALLVTMAVILMIKEVRGDNNEK